MDNGTTRREFIEQMSMLGMASMLPLSFFSCGNSAEEIDYQGTGLAPYKVWEEMLMAVKTSPDFLEGRMQTLIKKGNPEEMFHFVKDEIFLMPSATNSMNGMGEIMRYGLKGVLRYGFATPREKAELLHKMYLEAGISSEIVYERTNIQVEEIPAFFFRPFERTFNPKINNKILNRWQKEMNSEENEDAIIKMDKDQSESKKLADQLWDLIPEKETIKPHKFDLRWDNYSTPTVAFIWEEETKYAHLFDPEIPFGNLKNDYGGNVSKAKEAIFSDEDITVTLSYSGGVDYTTEKELVSGTWPIHEVAGNQLLIEFANGLTFNQQFYTPIGNLRKFTSIISFQSFDEDLEYQNERSFIGKTFTLEGTIISQEENAVKVGDTKLLNKPNADLQKEVQNLKVDAFPGTYPLVKLHISPINADGELIEGLSASDFLIADNENSANAILENNQRTPKIYILYDTSLSMPSEYLGENMDKFITDLELKILEKYPDANIEKWITGSSLYTGLLRASQTSCDLIVYATDGDNDDTYDPNLAPIYHAGAPAIILNVGNTEASNRKESFINMANATSGIVLNAKDQQETILNIMNFLDQIEIPPYVFTYYACDAEKFHEVEVNIDHKRVIANATYSFEVFPDQDQLLGSHIAGLYLTVKSGRNTVKRVLAGWDPELHRKRKPVYADFTAVKNTILGGALISIEGEGPTLSNALADILKYKLSTRAWGEALLQNKEEEAKKAFEKGGYNYNIMLATLMQPITNGVTANSFTYASGPRISVLKNYLGINEKTSYLSFDYLPTSGYSTISVEESESFKITLQKTAQLAIFEKDLFQKSAFKELQNKNLIERKTAIAEKWFDDKYKEGPDAAFWYEKIFLGAGHFKIVDQNAAIKSHWKINANTGEVYGILEDGTGGGQRSIEQQLKDIQAVVEVYMEVVDLMKKGNLALSIVATYGMTLVKLYAIVSEVLVVMDAGGMDDKIRDALIELACNIAKDITFGMMGKSGEIMGGLNKIIGKMGGSGLPGMQC